MTETQKDDTVPTTKPATRARQAERTGLWRILTLSVVAAVVALGIVWIAAA